ncbi:MAG: 50S ribosomal protein L9 [Chlamydiales bacterium]|nr:50S ribosomal protein L9 [Chlamydiales bacterium]
MATHLLLLEDVENLGRSGDIVSVRPGFARNFLLPKKKALVADQNARRMQLRLQEERAKQAVVDKQEAEDLSVRVKDMVFTVEVKVDPDGNMYGSVTALDIQRLFEAEGVKLEKRSVHLAQPIKSTGVHTVELRLKEGVISSCKVKIVPEGYVEDVVVEVT